MATLKARWGKIVRPLIAEHHGRLVKLMGDGVLVEFGSAVDAVQCAITWQEQMAQANGGLPEASWILLRIGINLGDVIIEEGDLFGDGVNVAARLESLAEPGGICLSGSVYDQVKRKLPTDFAALGPQMLKNIAEPVHVYRIRLGNSAKPVTASQVDEPLALPAKPSIAVLPFTNMSQDTEQETFVDGLTEDLITDLSRHSELFVIARHSTFAYKGKAADVRQIARDLGVRYLLEGSARRAAERVRINAQLVDVSSGEHLWAERFDRELEDIFRVQDEVIGRIVEALLGRLVAPPPRIRPTDLRAYDLCVRARALVGRSPEAEREATLLLEQAIALDPGYAEAYRWLAFNLWTTWVHCGGPIEPNRHRAVELAERAVAFDPHDAGSRWVLGLLLAYEGRWSESDAEYATALKLDPNHADAWAMQSELLTYNGQSTAAIEGVQKALRLNPHPAGWYYGIVNLTLLVALASV
ncbi:adenylate/guanylate cyclase domain-containing protein [Microvirga soli]|uniref:adenylate/guanylate cyclase domain-containing protein n=1 Tax=Microvirga soli TaxID=1854496 RepID=UPI001FE58B80|nr:adenylate/guanylate cyclase domain-containing protein [Microvirga soli]